MQEFRAYLSDRGIPLVYNHAPQDKPVLTVENYLKWYAFYLVMPNGSVEVLPYDRYRHLEGVEGLPYLWGDHVPHPAAYDRICEELAFYSDCNSADMITGRHVNDVLDGQLPA